MARPEFAVIFSKLAFQLIHILMLPLRYRAKFRMLSHLIESLNPIVTANTKHGAIDFYCPAHLPFIRSDIKGPHMLSWIDGFHVGDVLWDVGANVGAYSLYAAKRGVKVIAFEPAAANYFILAKNIEANNMDQNISGLNIALHNERKLDYLYMEHTHLGSAQHNFGSAGVQKRNSSKIVRRQAVIALSADEFLEEFSPPFPTHIKIDVDGNEALIISGASKILSDHRVKSVVIETREETFEKTVKFMKNEHGYSHKNLSFNDPSIKQGDILFIRDEVSGN